MHAPRCSSPNWDMGRLLCVCLIQLPMISGRVATDVFVLNSKKKVTHLLAVFAFYCQRPDSAFQNSLSKSLLAKRIRHADWLASLVAWEKRCQFERSTTSWNGSERRTLPGWTWTRDAVATTSADTVLHVRHSPCHMCTRNVGLATTSCCVDIPTSLATEPIFNVQFYFWQLLESYTGKHRFQKKEAGGCEQRAKYAIGGDWHWVFPICCCIF